MTRAYLAFTEKGLALAQKLASALPGTVARCGHGGPGLADWAAEQFAHADALIFVGAVGIAVRAIAPHCRNKAVDPAVVVLDECGHFAVPILSGHLGGANDLARALAAVCGAVPVITTATDANGVFAVDAWARHQNCAVLEPGRIKRVSSRLLAGLAFLVSEHRGLPYFNFGPLRPGRPSPGFPYLKASLWFKCQRLRNFHRMCIDYAFRPRLSSRLTLGGRTFPKKP